jgi:uncharacterized iron-regulated protein
LGAVSLSNANGNAADSADLPELQQALLRALEKEISAVRGLAFKSPVVARLVPQPKDADKQASLTYDATAKKLLLASTPDRCDRGDLIRCLVQALLDQHFDLAQLRRKANDADAELALAGLIEGDAMWTFIEMRRREDPKSADLLDQPWVQAVDLRRAFVSVQGARYVRALHARGGWKRVDAAYRFPPATSAALLHPEGVTQIDLGPGQSRGEFGLIEQLRKNALTAPAALGTAAGWQGDRIREEGAQKAWVIAFATAGDARRCQGALAILRSAADPELQLVRGEADAQVWHRRSGSVLAIKVKEDRVYVLEAPDEKAYRAWCDKVEGPPALAIYVARKDQPLTLGVLVDHLLEADLVCIGETHDSDLHHQVQLQIIKALFARDERLGVGMEMFQRPFQDALDRYTHGTLSEEDFLMATEYKQRWGFAWSLYRPITDYCRRNGVPLAALNAPKALTSRISQVGYVGLSEDERRQLGPIDFQVAKHRDFWYERLAAMHGQKDVPVEQKERSYQVMTTWDDYMAASAARFQQERHLRRLVILAGSGHIERGFGIPERTRKHTGGKVLTIGIQVGGEATAFHREPLTDFLVIVK